MPQAPPDHQRGETVTAGLQQRPDQNIRLRQIVATTPEANHQTNDVLAQARRNDHYVPDQRNEASLVLPVKRNRTVKPRRV